MGDWQPPNHLELTVHMDSLSSGLREIKLSGSSLGVVATLRAIMDREGLGVPREERTYLRLTDSGRGEGSIYVHSPDRRPVSGRETTHESAYKFALRVMEALNVTVTGDPLIPLEDPDEL